MIKFLSPQEFINSLNLKNDLMAADFGCGSGGFAIPLAKKLQKGFVWALDIQEEPLSALKGNAKLEGVSNIKTILCDLEEPKGSGLADQTMDLVLIINLFFQTKNKLAVLKEAKRVLKPKGRVIIVDWKPDAPFGPDRGRVGPEEIEKLAKKIDFKKIKEIRAGSYHWALIFEK
jgi:ubiquinone/menaquinone biosynthesis C-methylase UbiE